MTERLEYVVRGLGALLLATALTGCNDSTAVLSDGGLGSGGPEGQGAAAAMSSEAQTGSGSTTTQTGADAVDSMQDMEGMGGANDGAGEPGTDNAAVDLERMPLACPDGNCECPAGENCAFDCSDGGCLGETKCNAGDCTAECPDGDCKLDCDNGSTCDYSCEGGGCEFDCDQGSDCTISCAGGGCDVACDAMSICTVDCETDGDACNVSCEAGGMVEECQGECESDSC